MTPRPELAEALRAAARRHGTPAYVYDLPRLTADADAVRHAFPDPWLRLYSLKANALPALVRHISQRGFSASAVSGGELQLAARAGLRPSAVALEGIGKTEADLAYAARLAVDDEPLLWVSLETAEDAAALARAVRAAARRRRINDLRQDVLIRLNPQVRPETVGGLAVGAAESKFGALAEELPNVVEAGGGPAGPLRWRGLHVHVGSQLGAVDAWRSAFRQGLRLLELQRAQLPDFDTLDAGGGFPAAGTDVELPATERFAAEAAAELARLPAASRPSRLAVEPGRAVVAAAGWLVARVLHVRHRERPVVVLDAGMTELIRPALYGAVHPLVALTSRGRKFESGLREALSVRVDGPVCESTDTFGEAALPPLQRGDIVAIGGVGAYGSAMAATYNGRPRAPELGWDEDRTVILRRRGSAASLP